MDAAGQGQGWRVRAGGQLGAWGPLSSHPPTPLLVGFAPPAAVPSALSPPPFRLLFPLCLSGHLACSDLLAL